MNRSLFSLRCLAGRSIRDAGFLEGRPLVHSAGVWRAHHAKPAALLILTVVGGRVVVGEGFVNSVWSRVCRVQGVSISSIKW